MFPAAEQTVFFWRLLSCPPGATRRLRCWGCRAGAWGRTPVGVGWEGAAKGRWGVPKTFSCDLSVLSDPNLMSSMGCVCSRCQVRTCISPFS